MVKVNVLCLLLSVRPFLGHGEHFRLLVGSSLGRSKMTNVGNLPSYISHLQNPRAHWGHIKMAHCCISRMSLLNIFVPVKLTATSTFKQIRVKIWVGSQYRKSSFSFHVFIWPVYSSFLQTHQFWLLERIHVFKFLSTLQKSFSCPGLLRVTSSPVGLTYDSNFISGTREEVISTYRATCCAPRVMITAVDAFGNANSYVVDISSEYINFSACTIMISYKFLNHPIRKWTYLLFVH